MATVNTNVPAVWADALTDVRTSTEGPRHTLGQYREENGKGYRYVKQEGGTGSVAAVAGNLCYLIPSSDTFDVTMDVSDTDRNLVFGAYLSVIADEGFGWVQTYGRHSTVKTNGDDDVAKGDAIIASAAGDGTADSTAQDTAPICRVVGWALADDVNAADTVDTFLCLE